MTRETTDPSSCVTSNPTVRYPNPDEFKARLLIRTIRTETGCLLWTGGTDLARGYGKIRTPDGIKLTHRLAYELTRGPIPEGLHIDHVCHTENEWCTSGPSCLHRRCVNPDHLEAVTPEENFRRGRVFVLGSTCTKGHPFDEANTRFRPGGGRVCRACDRERERNRPRRERAPKSSIPKNGESK